MGHSPTLVLSERLGGRIVCYCSFTLLGFGFSTIDRRFRQRQIPPLISGWDWKTSPT